MSDECLSLDEVSANGLRATKAALNYFSNDKAVVVSKVYSHYAARQPIAK